MKLCPFCNSEIRENEVFCPTCGEELGTSEAKTAYSSNDGSKQGRSYEREYREEEFPWLVKAIMGNAKQVDNGSELPYEEAKKFNWGATFTAFWLVSIKEVAALRFFLVMFVFNLLNIIPIVSFITGPLSFIVFLVVAIYLGLYGNRIAWRYKYWDSQEEFNKVQKGWAVTVGLYWGFVALCIIIAICLLCLGVFAAITAGAAGAASGH